jgi:hypothetical protein
VARPHGHTFTVTSRGQEWRGTWSLDGKDVCVSSAFGSARVAKGRKPPADVAAETLKGLVDEWATRR